MLTKTGGALIKEALILGSITGGVRANNLSQDDRKILTRYYGLDSDASLGWRNAGRGLLGEALGSIPGRLLRNVAMRNGNAQLHSVGRAVSLAGAIIGIKKGTDKYSVGNARSLREQLRRLSGE